LADLVDDTQRVKGIGEIIVKVFRKGETVKQSYGPSPGSTRDGGMSEVHEKALKGEAKSHSVS
jgi:hypothetical protein